MVGVDIADVVVAVDKFSCSSSDARPRFDRNRLDERVTSLTVDTG